MEFSRDFDARLYRLEMSQLLALAKEKYLNATTKPRVFVMSIWTDANAAASAIALETLQHSTEFTGDSAIHNDSPADFEYRFFAECDHKSFPLNWEESSQGTCWLTLNEELKKVGELALTVLSGFEFESNAIIGINSDRDWFDTQWKI